MNYLKHLAIERKHFDLSSLEKENAVNLEEKMEEAELEHKIFQIISGLAPRCQEIFKMSRIKGFKNQEISENLNISIRTVETQISVALKALRRGLGEDIDQGKL